MAPDELASFYEASLTGGAVISGFIGTFLSFRIQREANYHRQPVLDFESEEARDVDIGLSHFTSSFLLLILAAIVSIIFGVAWPLLALAKWPPAMKGPAPIVGGFFGSIALVSAYFFDELVHYRILKGRLTNDMAEWKSEWGIVVGGVVFAILAYVWAQFVLGPTS